MQKLKLLFLLALAGLMTACSVFKKNAVIRSSNPQEKVAELSGKNDSASRITVKPYKEIIIGKAITDSGLLIIHRVDNRYYLEIPVSYLGKDFLVATRISKAAAGNRPFDNLLGYAGDLVNENVIEFVTEPGNKLFIYRKSYSERSMDSSENGLYRSVHNSNLQPVIAAFDIKAYGKDSVSVVADFTEFLNGDNNLLFFAAIFKSAYLVNAYQADKSYIKSSKSFPANVEFQCLKTYTKSGTETISYELNTSIVKLPDDIMKPRFADARVGYFVNEYTDFDAPQGAQVSAMITRWRLEPRDEDKDAYLKGKLVEPRKPIVYYIDPATPKKWVPYIIAGVNDWQKAFEKAGFKNAIYALEAPENNPEWNLYDARHNAILYKASVMANASGPHIHDPRSGEILETHINLFHNLFELLHDWYMVQVGPNDPQARRMVFEDSLMGKLLRFAVSHEVGHTLGLAHNFGSSSTISVDSLREKEYVKKNGFCPSIMDYARFNYVAQPQDQLDVHDLLPRIGVYDEWAINWGYRWMPEIKSREEEKAFMNKWIRAELAKDNRLFYGGQQLMVIDPRSQSEDLGNDAVAAGIYGIHNLKVVMSNLIEWTKEPDADYNSLSRLQDQVINQYLRYIFHVSNNIGLYTLTPKTVEESGAVIEVIPKQKQKAAVVFLQEQLFNTPAWLMNKEVFSRLGKYGPYISYIIQNQLFDYLIEFDRYFRMSIFEADYPDQAYTFDEMLTDFEKNIWKELDHKVPIDFYRSNLQRIYLERLLAAGSVIEGNPISKASFELKKRTAFLSIVQSHVRKTKALLEKSIPAYKQGESKNHLVGLLNKLKQSDGRSLSGAKGNANMMNTFHSGNVFKAFCPQAADNRNGMRILSGCWTELDSLFGQE